MESKIILLHGDKLIKIKSQPSNDLTIFEEIEHTNLINDDEKNKYLEFLNNQINKLTSVLMNINNEKIEIFINPIHPRMKIYYCDCFDYCKIFNYDEDAIIKFTNCTLYHGRIHQMLQQHESDEDDDESDEEEEHIFIRKECFESKVQSECPICYDNTSCYEFFKCDHFQCFDCYLQMKKFKCALCRSD
jgi:hypothetical protein